MNFLNEFKKWLDGEDAVAQTPAEKQQQMSEWDEFFIKIAREVEAVMKREMFTPPGGATYLPGEYIIYLSKEDDQLWQGRKRRALEEGLQHSLIERAGQLVGDRTLQSDRVAFSFSVDGALAKGGVRVQAIWDEDSPKTAVTPRRHHAVAAPPAPVPLPETPITEPLDPLRTNEVTAALTEEPSAGPNVEPGLENDRTVIRPRAPRFKLKYVAEGQPAREFEARQDRIEIGRGAADLRVDLKLEGDSEISRRHAVLTRTGDGVFQLECVGRNSIEAAGRELETGQQAEVRAGEPLKIGIYELTVTN